VVVLAAVAEVHLVLVVDHLHQVVAVLAGTALMVVGAGMH